MVEVWTIRDILLWSSNFLKSKDIDTARLDAELLMSQALGCQRIDLYCHYDKPVDQEEKATIRSYLQRRAAGEPVAYILGQREFYGREFSVSSDVLIPRPETEHLIEAVLELHKTYDFKSILDVGTGSGAIAVTLGKEVPGAHVEAWDVSEKALALAQTNATRWEQVVEFKVRDALKEDTWLDIAEPFDLICSNPPYIGEHEKGIMGASVLNFEPHVALFAEDGGFAFYKALARLAQRALTPDGHLVLEIGATQGEKVVSILEDHGWRSVTVIRDLANLPRIVKALAPKV
ncbi:peptide chain release factor N(5)-glutamine methyltransferase [Pseudobacteriovorax antillogorgiicola]|uniref:Release factor glutamine methyltransferase n=1 Tax=Pseudobacteriovorax antillogorgiicola TaxID=1513793 RepID=A0A1Y6B6X7_9BACT|nr:peptide chain release factor N(5)-glutamine methyltransferase [Pseudobacteriovorax antillogorgiicola]TCS59542.1 [protein release factor]-glutamine N5-methyltransferase [Pseudobacteriovorax antillogorgiicola]SME87779.1 [protein release factor]-glutamine N5-methyltransferase [Pseudobacteriovorax antillogorgiicola]